MAKIRILVAKSANGWLGSDCVAASKRSVCYVREMSGNVREVGG